MEAKAQPPDMFHVELEDVEVKAQVLPGEGSTLDQVTGQTIQGDKIQVHVKLTRTFDLAAPEGQSQEFMRTEMVSPDFWIRLADSTLFRMPSMGTDRAAALALAHALLRAQKKQVIVREAKP